MRLTLRDVLDNLVVGELAQTSWAADGEFSIPTTNKIITLINAGLSELSTRFWLKNKQVSLQTCCGMSLYVLDKRVADQQAQLEGFCYLIPEDGDLFKDDLIQITGVKDANGTQLKMNMDTGSSEWEYKGMCGCGNPAIGLDDYNDLCECCRVERYTETLDKPGTITTATRWNPYGWPSRYDKGISVGLASYNTLRVHPDLQGQVLEVTYRAAASKVKKVEDNGMYDPDRITIDLPRSYLDALCFYIASRKFNANIQGVGQQFHEGNNYYQKYIAACTLLETQGVGAMPAMDSSDKFMDKGFV